MKRALFIAAVALLVTSAAGFAGLRILGFGQPMPKVDEPVVRVPGAQEWIPATPKDWGIERFTKEIHPDLHYGMNYSRIRNTDLWVSQLCIGSATFGDSVNQESANNILDLLCKKYGANFVDTSELFPNPRLDPKVSGTAERIVGNWLKRQDRSSIILSNRVAGYSDAYTVLRGGETVRLTKKQIKKAVEDSLTRLQTDYIDLLLLGWPDRYVQLPVDLQFDPTNVREAVPIAEQLEAVNELIGEGKVRHYGLGDETPFGLAQWHFAARERGLRPPVVVSNRYNLLDRNNVDTHLLEAVYHLNMSFIGYAPFARGALTGKYLDEIWSTEGRLHKYYGFDVRYLSRCAEEATYAHKLLSDKCGVPLHLWSMNYALTRTFMSAVCFGVSSLEQAQENILSLNVRLPEMDDIEEDVEEIFKYYADPTRGPLRIVPVDYRGQMAAYEAIPDWEKFKLIKSRRIRMRLEVYLKRSLHLSTRTV